jgi:hypothetical protein
MSKPTKIKAESTLFQTNSGRVTVADIIETNKSPRKRCSLIARKTGEKGDQNIYVKESSYGIATNSVFSAAQLHNLGGSPIQIRSKNHESQSKLNSNHAELLKDLKKKGSNQKKKAPMPKSRRSQAALLIPVFFSPQGINSGRVDKLKTARLQDEKSATNPHILDVHDVPEGPAIKESRLETTPIRRSLIHTLRGQGYGVDSHSKKAPRKMPLADTPLAEKCKDEEAVESPCGGDTFFFNCQAQDNSGLDKMSFLMRPIDDSTFVANRNSDNEVFLARNESASFLKDL